eukprot:TRINITY_DN1886_c0_g1_i4.p1 TRINITY_DN1886_c0_g1~~TRINITY_DN1886_c0_g1_i4.p1  ORF type:complete len:1121 (+),score=124.49 TRINITY_DN1886_c0_g1_i4:176-3364(+)
MPLGITYCWWASSYIEHQVFLILVEEILGHQTASKVFGNSLSQFLTVAGCNCALGPINTCKTDLQCSSNGEPWNWHVAVGSWTSYISAAANELRINYYDQYPVALGDLGYPARDGMFIGSEPMEQALPLPLDYYRTYNNNTYDVSGFFSKVGDIPSDRLMPCQESNLYNDLEIKSYLKLTGDTAGVHSPDIRDPSDTSKYHGHCYDRFGNLDEGNGRWWLSPGCRWNVTRCIPLITGGDGWSYNQWMLKATFYSMPIALGVSKDWSNYVSLPRDFSILFYWWYPDDTFTAMHPIALQFPQHNKTEWAAANTRTASLGDPIVKYVHWDLVKPENPESYKIQEVLRNMQFIQQHVDRFVLDFFNFATADPSMTGDELGYRIACEWLRTSADVWERWIPLETECLLGQGLIDNSTSPNYVHHRSLAAGCEWCPPGKFSASLTDAKGTTHQCIGCQAGRFQLMPGKVSCTNCAAGRYADSEGTSECHLCPIGFYCNGSSEIEACPNDTTTELGAAARSQCKCKSGFQNLRDPHEPRVPGEADCRACPAGTSKPRSGPGECDICEVGRWADVGSSECGECGDGEVPNAARSRCEPCSLGLRKLNSACATCPKGSVPDSQGSFCISCSESTIAQPGDDSCKMCPGLWPIILDNECYYSHTYMLLIALLVCPAIIYLLYKVQKRRRKARELQDFQKQLQACMKARDWNGLWAHKRAASKSSTAAHISKIDKAADEVLRQVYKESASLGISITYVLGSFRAKLMELVKRQEWRQGPHGPGLLQSFIAEFGGSVAAPPAEWHNADKTSAPSDPNFIQIAPLVAFGTDAPGFNLTCPRDGQKHCGIVDAVVSKGDSGEANQFLSWVWQYRVSTVVEALNAWSKEANIVFCEDEGGVTRISSHHEKVCIWWCFFCNNQYRILADCRKKSTKELSDAFGSNVRRVGKMWMLLDDLHEPMYLSRIWCIFEVFVARKYDVPCRAIISHGFGTHPIEKIDELFDTCKVDAAAARASMKEDEDGIKNLIEDEFGSFDAVNLAVERQLNMVVLDSLRRERNNQGNTPTITLEYTDVFGI